MTVRRPAIPRSERVAAERARLALDPLSHEDPSVWVVMVSRCLRCGSLHRFCPRTGADDVEHEECTAGLPHEWCFAGRSVVTGSHPWLGRVPGQVQPGTIRSCRAGDVVWSGVVKTTIPADGVYRVHLRDGRLEAERDETFEAVGAIGEFRRRAPIRHRHPKPEAVSAPRLRLERSPERPTRPRLR